MRSPGKYPQMVCFSSVRDPTERPGKGDGLEVWLRLPVATGPE